MTRIDTDEGLAMRGEKKSAEISEIRGNSIVSKMNLPQISQINTDRTTMATENDISYKIRGAIFAVYNALGPGLLETIYEAALCYQLRKDGLKVENQVRLDIYYDGKLLPVDYRLDILVEERVVVELKSVEKIANIHHKQLLTYLKIAKKRLGILVNFNAENISENIFRKVNNL